MVPQIPVRSKIMWHTGDLYVANKELIRSTKAYLCPNMTHFVAVDFSECRSEEVISFFWSSVCSYYLVNIFYWNKNLEVFWYE